VKGMVHKNQKNHYSWSSKHVRNFTWISSEHFQRKFLWRLSYWWDVGLWVWLTIISPSLNQNCGTHPMSLKQCTPWNASNGGPRSGIAVYVPRWLLWRGQHWLTL
jgi:hypothetical protein